MIDHATAIDGAARPDAGYKSWQSSMGRAVMQRDPEARTAAPLPTFGRMVHDNVVAAQSYGAVQDNITAGQTPDLAYAPSDEEFSFGDVIDMINPLQHLPVVGALYRKFTGDTIKPMSDIIGGAIFGGPVGAVSSTVNAVVKSTTGRDITENAFALAGFDVAPKTQKPVIAYEKAAALSSGNNMAFTNLVEDLASNGTFTPAADGRRNFASRTVSTQSWNA